MNQPSDDLVNAAAAQFEAVRQARHHRALEYEAAAFTRLLATVPDHHAPGALGMDAIARLRELAESVIVEIERCVRSRQSSDAAQVHLVSWVYDIRRELEEIDRWSRHYFGTS
jgi:hypothetical protein